MRIHLSDIPDDVIEEYNLREIVSSDGWAYIEIQKGMYGLPQAGILAQKLLAKRLAKYGYFQCRHTPGLWKHITRPTRFNLVVDDFFAKINSKGDGLHLTNALKSDYTITEDWDAKLFCGITFKWNYSGRRYVDLSMPGYVEKALQKFNHPAPKKPQDAPHPYNPVQYGVAQQMSEPEDTSPPLDKDGINRIQRIVGTFLYKARAVDPTIVTALSTLSSEQSKATEYTNKKANQLMDYLATHPDATLRYYASDMVLKFDSDAGYLNAGKSRSRAGGHFYFGNHDETTEPTYQGSILNPSAILKHVASSAAEAELGALFVNCKEATVIRQTLSDMGYPQGATPCTTDNSTANGMINDTIKKQRSRAMDMRYMWVQDRVRQGHFVLKWKAGKDNMADYQTKHHAPAHHRTMRPRYVLNSLVQLKPLALRGCVELRPFSSVTRGSVVPLLKL